MRSDTAGGAERSVRVAVVRGTLFAEQLHLWRACREAGTDITLIGTDFNPYASGKWPWRPEVPSDIPTVLLTPVRLRRRKGHHWWIYPHLGRVLRQISPDIVHVRSEPWTPLTLQVLLLKATGRIRSSIVVHGDEFTFWTGFSPKRVLQRAVMRWTLARLDGYVCINSMGSTLARTHGLRLSSPTTALPAIVPDLTRFKPPTAPERAALRRTLALPTGETVVAYIGRLEREKGVLDLLSAASAVRCDFFLAVWGTGSIEQEVARRLENLSRVSGRFLGPLDLAKVANAMQATDVVVVPSRAEWNEQFGRVAVEAMACGCAVIATRSGALPEVVGDAGLLVQPNDPLALQYALERLAADEGERLRLGARGRERALKYFAPQAVASSMRDYWNLIGDTSRRNKS